MQARALTIVLVLVTGSPAQVGLRAGPARFAVPDTGTYGRVAVLQAGRPVGHGEIVGWLGRLAEFRGTVPRGRFRLGPARPVQGRVARDVEVVHPTMVWEPREGSLCTRWRGQARGETWRLRCDLFAWRRGARELRLWLQATDSWDPTQRLALEIRAGMRHFRRVRGPGFRILDAGQGQVLVAAPGVLRAGDATYVVLADASESDPSGAVVDDRATDLLGFRVARRRNARAAAALQRAIDTLVAVRPPAPVDRGDYVRRTYDDRRIWTHGEFDLALGLELTGARLRASRWREAAFDSALHTMGRDVARHGPARLPVRHGPVHGRGVADTGHVFLEGALVVAAARADRLLAEAVLGVFDELATAVASRSGVERLRELAWPLRNFETGLRLVDRRDWRAASTRVIERLVRHWDASRGSLVFPENRATHGRTRLDLWLVSGLLLPALRDAADRGSTPGRRLGLRIARLVAELPRPRGVLATHYSHTARRGWRALHSAVPPVCESAWLAEGLPCFQPTRWLAARQQKAIRARLPGTTWDPATRLALCLRLDWVRALF